MVRFEICIADKASMRKPATSMSDPIARFSLESVMPRAGGQFLRDNAFLAAAVSLPLVVVAFFLVSSLIARWTVPPPAYDLLVRTDGAYDAKSPRFAVEYTVRDGKVEAIVRPLPANTYIRPGELFVFEHGTMAVRRVPVDLPQDVGEKDPPRTIAVEALAGRRLLEQPKAPDGYEFDTRTRRGPGIVGEVFGMNHYDPGAAVVNKGRVVPITLPSRYPYSRVYPVGWLADTGSR